MSITQLSDEDQSKNLVVSLEFANFPLILILHPQTIAPMFSVSPLSAQVQTVSKQLRIAPFRRPLAAALGCSLIVGSLMATMGTAIANPAPAPLADGVYVFGESPTAHQPGTTYMVMQVSGHDINGGFYQPASSFDCFYGETNSTNMTLTVIDSYAQTKHPLAMTLETATTVASENATASQWVPTGFHRLADVTATDRQVLQTCTNL
ncbi:hypothetical protein [Halomicronema sp. CCY15110]|uniref:hypothetical protein n=1 Tax=Halomicronema sp. CCY15110 TaxID=2767773 RepID=UPI0019504B86|nr:hypothetical protein [Halomicronema sp. CCY15110]